MKKVIGIELIVSFVIAVGCVALLFGAVMQESYKNCPPTPTEVKDNPSLARYLK